MRGMKEIMLCALDISLVYSQYWTQIELCVEELRKKVR